MARNRNLVFAALSTLALGTAAASTVTAQELVEQDFRRWTIHNPKVGGQEQFKFEVRKEVVLWSAIRGRNWRLRAGASTKVTVPAQFANKPLMLDFQTYGGGTGTEIMHVSLGKTLNYTEAQDGPFVHQQIVRLPAGVHELKVLAKGSNMFSADTNVISIASLRPVTLPIAKFRIPAVWPSGPYSDFEMRGTPKAVAFAFFSPRLMSPVKVPTIRGLLVLAQPSLTLTVQLDANGRAVFPIGYGIWRTLRPAARTASYWQVLEVGKLGATLGMPVTLRMQ